jgi:hypothetical protein
MPKKKDAEISCPKCGARNSMAIWDVLNTSADGDAKEDLLNGKINYFQCGSCDFRSFIPYPLLYHDVQKKFVVYFLPDDELERSLKSHHFTADGELRIDSPRFFSADNENGDYFKKIRVVFTMMELINYVRFRERLSVGFVPRGDDTGERVKKAIRNIESGNE